MGLSPPLLVSGFRSGGVESPFELSPLLESPLLPCLFFNPHLLRS